MVLASGRAEDADGDALPIHQDAALLCATLAAGSHARHVLKPGRRAYLVAPRGRIAVNGVEAQARDGIAVSEEAEIDIEALEESEIVLVDLP